MKNYRIRKTVGGIYYVQRRFLFLFWKTIVNYAQVPIYFGTLQQAEDGIDVWKNKDELIGEY